MTEKKRKQIVYGIFVVAIIWGLFNFPFDRKNTGNDRPYAEAYDEYDDIQEALASADGGIIDIGLLDKWGDDPFAQKNPGAQSSPERVSSLKLSAISKSGDDYWALINGKALTVGDEINGWKLFDISKSTARLRKGELTITLNIEGV